MKDARPILTALLLPLLLVCVMAAVQTRGRGPDAAPASPSPDGGFGFPTTEANRQRLVPAYTAELRLEYRAANSRLRRWLSAPPCDPQTDCEGTRRVDEDKYRADAESYNAIAQEYPEAVRGGLPPRLTPDLAVAARSFSASSAPDLTPPPHSLHGKAGETGRLLPLPLRAGIRESGRGPAAAGRLKAKRAGRERRAGRLQIVVRRPST